MKTYIAYLVQDCEGCDYTIGCAQTVIRLDATELRKAVEELTKEIKMNYTGDRQLSSAELYEVGQVIDIDLDSLYKEIELADQEQEISDREEQERKEYERLKTKFEK
jgi:hypothetical protein